MSQVTKKKVVKRRKRKPFATFMICAVLLGCSAFFIWNIVQEGVTTYTLQVDIHEAKAQLEALQKENGFLVNEKEKLEDENYVKNHARGEYMITKEGEKIFHLPKMNSGE